MRCPLIATASAIVKPSSTVTILPFTNIVSAGSAANADAIAESHSAARTRFAFFTERLSERVKVLFIPADGDDGPGARSRPRGGGRHGRQCSVETDCVLRYVGAAQIRNVDENSRGIDRDGAGIRSGGDGTSGHGHE